MIQNNNYSKMSIYNEFSNTSIVVLKTLIH